MFDLKWVLKDMLYDIMDMIEVIEFGEVILIIVDF